MADKFEWYSEEEVGWGPPLSSSPERRADTRRRKVGLILLLGLLAITTHGGLRRVTGAAAALVRQDVLSSYEVWLRAVAEGDEDLLNSVLSGSRPQWMVTQQALFRQDLLIDRRPLGMVVTGTEPTLVAFQSAPDLRAAEVVVQQTFQSVTAAEAVPFVLERTLVFRQGRERWLWSPPLPDFWGEWRTVDGRFLSLTYPQRDEQLALRLHADLEKQLQTACNAFLEFQCLPDFELRVRLANDPAILADTDNPAVTLRPAATLNLPAPSLVGIPVDETGYQALRLGYTGPVVAATISKAVGWTCCERGLFHQALIDQWLDQLNLRPWPMTAADYDAMFYQATFGVKGLYHYWDQPPASLSQSEQWHEVYATVAYLLELNPDVPLGAIHQRLVTSEDVWSWLRHYQVDFRGFNDQAQRSWLRFAAAQMPGPNAAVSLPEQDLQLLCRQGRSSPTLYRLDLEANDWTPEIADRSFQFLHPLASDDGVLLTERRFGPQRTAGLIWRGGDEEELFSLPRTKHLFRVDAAKTKLQLYEYDMPDAAVSFSTVDLDRCEEENCARTLLLGQPHWSPDLSRTLVETGEGVLFYGDEQGRVVQPVIPGTSPFWLTDEKFGYVNGDWLKVSRDDGDFPQIIASLSDWAQQIGTTDLIVRSIVPGPLAPDRLFVAVEKSDEQIAILAHDLSSGKLAWSVDIPCGIGPYQPLLFSPDGRWLVIRSFAPCTQPWQLTIIDVISGETKSVSSQNFVSFPGYDWSADSDWLVVVEDGYLQLLAPSHNYQRLIVHDFSDCDFAAWVN